MLTLYDYYRSSACFRVRIALHLKGLDYQTIPIHLLNQGGEQFTSSYQTLNPHALVPTLQHDDHLLTQSLAIIEYLDEIYPLPALLPNDADEKARVRAFALSLCADMHPLNNLRVLTYLKQMFHLSDEQKMQWYHHWVHKGLSALEKQLTSYSETGDFCFGHQPSLADICLVPQLYNARRFSCDLSAYPTLVRIDEHCQTLPAFTAAWPLEPVT